MRLKLTIAVMLALATTPACVSAAPSPNATALPATVILNASDTAALPGKRSKFAGLISRCAADLERMPKPLAIINSKRRYTATGVANIGEGKILAGDAEASYRLALCYLVTKEAHYAASAQRILDAWAETLTGVANHQSQGNVGFKLPFMIAAANWTRGANGWDSAMFDQFIVREILPESQSYNENNHGMWGVYLEASIGAHLGDKAILGKARKRWGEIIVGATDADGVLVREIQRSNTSNFRGGPTKGIKGIAYSHYFMLPATLAAKIFADQGIPVWRGSAESKLFEAAFRKAADFTLRPETFPFYASNNGKLENTRGVAYFPMLLKHYPDADAEAVLRTGEIGGNSFWTLQMFGDGIGDAIKADNRKKRTGKNAAANSTADDEN